jgi:hypothetical protein
MAVRSHVLVMIAALAMLCGCSRTVRVDASSSKSCSVSLAAVGRSAAASRDSAEYFDIVNGLVDRLALRSVGSSYSNVSSFSEDRGRRSVELPSADSTVMWGAVCEAFNGYSAHDIVSKEDSLSSRVNDAFDRRVAASYLALLHQAKAAFEAARDSLAQFRVDSVRLIQESDSAGLKTIIAFTVHNGTTHTVARAFFTGRAVSEGREIPWVDGEFNHSIPGGLAPGETARWQLKPNRFSGNWNKVRVPGGARFVVEMVKLVGADDQPLWGGPQFTAGDQRALDSLSAAHRN